METFLNSLRDSDTWITVGFLLFLMFVIIFPYYLHLQRVKQTYSEKWRNEDEWGEVEHNGKKYPMRVGERRIWARMRVDEKTELVADLNRNIKNGKLKIVEVEGKGRMIVATEKGKKLLHDGVNFYKTGKK